MNARKGPVGPSIGYTSRPTASPKGEALLWHSQLSPPMGPGCYLRILSELKALNRRRMVDLVVYPTTEYVYWVRASSVDRPRLCGLGLNGVRVRLLLSTWAQLTTNGPGTNMMLKGRPHLPRRPAYLGKANNACGTQGHKVQIKF